MFEYCATGEVKDQLDGIAEQLRRKGHHVFSLRKVSELLDPPSYLLNMGHADWTKENPKQTTKWMTMDELKAFVEKV